MSTINQFCDWLRNVRTACTRRRASRRERELRGESDRAIQVMEFAGKVWFCYGGTPLLEGGDLTADLPTALARARETWVNYRLHRTTFNNNSDGGDNA